VSKEKETNKPKEEILGQISDQAITSMMEETRVFPPPKEFSKNAAVKSMAEYQSLYNDSIKNPDKFWGKMAEQLEWYKKGINMKSMISKTILKSGILSAARSM